MKSNVVTVPDSVPEDKIEEYVKTQRLKKRVREKNDLNEEEIEEIVEEVRDKYD